MSRDPREGVPTYPYTIDNGHGERITFVGRVRSAEGETLEVENVVQPGVGPPMHTHLHQEEGLTVVRGRIGYQRKGEAPRFAEAGATVVFPAAVAHRFWNAGTDELRCTGYIRPPDNVEFFLSAIFAAQREGAGGRPGLFDAAYLVTRYRSEYRTEVVPELVQRFFLPLPVLIGRLLGRYGKFADAPPPVRRPRD